jgi:hypothetical protein
MGGVIEPEGQDLGGALRERSVVALMPRRYHDPRIGRFLSVDPVTAYSNPACAFER